jgi:hypothetical protein
MKRARRLDELTLGPDNMLARERAVPVKVTARVVRADTGGTLHPVGPRSLTFTVIRAPGKATRRRHLLWRA